jgi:hypothetical protein
MGRDGDGGVARRCSNRGNDDEANTRRGLRAGRVAPYSPLMPFPMAFVVLALQAAKVSSSTGPRDKSVVVASVGLDGK